MNTSKIWSYFEKRDDKNALCKRCSQTKVLKYNGRTSNLWNHLRSCHNKVYEELANEGLDISNEDRKAIDKMIEDTILFDMFPFSSVEHPSFKTLINYFAPNYTMPSINTLRRRINKRVHESRKNVYY